MRIIVLCFLACITVAAYGQDRLTGQIFEYKTRNHLPDIRIENLNNKAVAMSDTAGKFSIAAKPGDIIVYSGIGYSADTVYLTKLKFTEVFLILKTLGEVNVKSTVLKLGNLKSPPILGPLGGRTVVYTTDKDGNYIGGLTVKLMRGQGKVKNNSKLADLQLQEKIGQIFSEKNLKNYLPIGGQEMTNFIILYTPSTKTYKQISNLTLYLSNCYTEFVKIPLEQRQSKEYLSLK
jgi:hypothetical protein